MTDDTSKELFTALETILIKFFPVIGGVATAQLLSVAAVLEPIVASFVEAVIAMDKKTKEDGWHWVIPIPGDPDHLDGQPYITQIPKEVTNG